MLWRTLGNRRALIFLGLLSSVLSDASFSANNFGYDGWPVVTSALDDKCPGSYFLCNYWDSLRYKVTDSNSSNFIKEKQTEESATENRKSEGEAPEENSQEEISLEAPFITPDNYLNKRFSVFRKKSPIARDYKRGPGFRSWGGKRVPMLSEQNIDKKSKFVSWGGKRDGEFLPDDLINSELKGAPDKRPKFQNWGGKKSTNDFLEEYSTEIKKIPIWKDRFYLTEPFKKHVPKRPQFQSWGGKRALYPWHGFFEFSPSKPRFLLNGGAKRKFSSWGGKRYDDYVNQDVHSTKHFKAQDFPNWGEKRTSSDMVYSSQDNPNLFTTKESELSEKTKQRDKRKVEANWEDEENLFNLDSSGDEPREGKNRR